ncbi:MAG: LOG family protein [Pirellulales bacterium]
MTDHLPEEPLDLEETLAELDQTLDQPNGKLDRTRIVDLIDQIKESADKLAVDRTSRGDLKILSRTLRELRYAFKVFTPYRTRRKVTVFGSARTPPDAASYRQAVAFGQAMANEKWLVVTGAASGIMEAGHVGAGRENSMGLNIMLPFEQYANPVIAGDSKLVHMKYFFTRKLMFVKECDAVCLLPGGFGTLDEGLEVLTLLQTGKRDLVPVVFLDEPGGSFWTEFQEYVKRRLLGDHMISPEDLSLYILTDSVERSVAEILQFYKVFQSMRFVKNKLVFRLHQAPSPELLHEINVHFADILTGGDFALSGPLGGEDEPELATLSRLVFRFNRRSLGRLRQLVDVLNRGYLEPAEKRG